MATEQDSTTEVNLRKQMKNMIDGLIGIHLEQIVKTLRDPENVKKMKNMSDEEVIKDLRLMGYPDPKTTIVHSNGNGDASKPKTISSGKKALEGYESQAVPGKSMAQSKADCKKMAEDLSISEWYERAVKNNELICGHAKRPKKDSGDNETVCGAPVYNPKMKDKPECLRCCECVTKVGIITKMLESYRGTGSDKVKPGSHNKVNPKKNVPTKVKPPPEDDEETFNVIGNSDWYVFGCDDFAGFVFMQKDDESYCIGKYLDNKGNPMIKSEKQIKELKKDDDWHLNLVELNKKEIKMLKPNNIIYNFQGSIDD